METLSAQIRRARRRLLFQQFLAALSGTWFTGLVIALVAIVAGKLWPPGVTAMVWAAAWLAGGTAGGFIAAGVGTALRPRSQLDAACEIDRRFGLKERVSTAAALSPVELATEAGQAVLHDAAERVGRLRVADRFAIGPSRCAWLPLVPAILAMLLTLFVPARRTETVVEASTVAAAQVKNSAQTLGKRLEEKRAEAIEKGLQDADDILKKIADGTRKLSDQEKADPKQALLELNDLAKDLQRRRDRLVVEDKLKQHLNQLKDLDRGPAEKFGQAMKTGDFKRAVEELTKLQDRLADGKLGQEEREKLAEQLERMQQSLQKAATVQQEARDDLARRIAEQRQAGHQQEAERLQQQLDQLEQQRHQEEQMSSLAKKLCKAGECMRQGDAKAACQALDAVSEELQAAQQSSEELAMLDEAMEQIGAAKASMNCKECRGAGCKACQGDPHGLPGRGLGKGRGAGVRPEDKTETGLYDSKVAQNVRRGAAIIAGEAEGPNRKGEVQESIKEQFESARHEAADPLTSQRLPRDYREHAKKYFESLREGAK